jgi:hypothetical protein
MVLLRGLRGRGLSALRIKRRNSTYRGVSSHHIINWGAHEGPAYLLGALNKPDAVRKSSDKVLTFETIGDVGIPYTTDIQTAHSWSEDDNIVFARTLTRASEGRGIIVVHPGDELPSAPLYTKGITNCTELRIHIFKGSVILCAQKKSLGSEAREERGIEDEPDPYVRNTNNGWIFAVNDIYVSEKSKEVALAAMESIGLDFGAVDVIQKDGEVSFVLEVNSSPGIMEGSSTETAYLDAFEAYYAQLE